MKKIILPTIIFTVLLTACNKENDMAPFSAKGLWHGNMYYFSVSILNRDNGTARLYIGAYERDTTRGNVHKFEGIYTSAANSYNGRFYFNNDSLSFLSDVASGTGMEGMTYVMNASQVFPFKLQKAQ
jgi:hypothetical protein